MTIRVCIALCSAAVFATGCGEKPQTHSNAAARKTDAQAWQGADNRYVASGWKAGDRASWEAQMRARAMAQNEYTRVANK